MSLLRGRLNKRRIRIGLTALFCLDAVLLVVWWRVAGQTAQEELLQQVDATEQQVRLLRVGLEKARLARQRLPEAAAACDRFYTQNFPPATAGYTAVVADLGELTQEAGVTASGLRFEEKGASQHGTREVAVAATVEGPYGAVLRFLDGLERSRYLYLVDSLQLSTAGSSRVKMSLRLRTFFRTER